MSTIEDIMTAAEDMADAAAEAIDGLVHDGAVQLLNAMLPPMVHGGNELTKAAAWAQIAAHSAAVQAHRAGLGMGNTVLAGMVAKKVDEGLAHLAKDTDYARAVNSIR
ncbi:hypothetical protein [Leifsonia sp. C5G2]|uniref:hypothetical protein n=1 Tax=Leifsonia sp. C5G2 TaxID=2735269 RepID=UPI0015851A4B|nr:hypothetical protein [Leifsonia sp. C5G2]NUU05097.1 hypothetical protein [Leifsonia sp. C5G2]